MKMELISALIHEPRVLFLDEPTIGLDVVSQKRVREFLRIYNEEHRIRHAAHESFTCKTSKSLSSGARDRSRQDLLRRSLDEIIDRFSGHKILSLTFDKQVTREFSRFGEVIEQTPVSVQLKVPRAKVTETCRELLQACDVSDIKRSGSASRGSDPSTFFGERRVQYSATTAQSTAAAGTS